MRMLGIVCAVVWTLAGSAVFAQTSEFDQMREVLNRASDMALDINKSEGALLKRSQSDAEETPPTSQVILTSYENELYCTEKLSDSSRDLSDLSVQLIGMTLVEQAAVPGNDPDYYGLTSDIRTTSEQLKSASSVAKHVITICGESPTILSDAEELRDYAEGATERLDALSKRLRLEGKFMK